MKNKIWLITLFIFAACTKTVTGPAVVYHVPAETEEREDIHVEYFVVSNPPEDTSALGNVIRDFLTTHHIVPRWGDFHTYKRVFLEETSDSPRNYKSTGPEDHLSKNLEDIRCIQTLSRKDSGEVKSTFRYYDSDGMAIR